jgi:hypothetical protein
MWQNSHLCHSTVLGIEYLWIWFFVYEIRKHKARGTLDWIRLRLYETTTQDFTRIERLNTWTTDMQCTVD